jgi:Na+/H+ antiporter NhaC
MRVLVLLIMLLAGSAHAGEVDRFEVEWPARRLWVGAGDVARIKVRAVERDGRTATDYAGTIRIEGLGVPPLTAAAGVVEVPPALIQAERLVVSDGTTETTIEVPTLPGALTLLPALLAIGLALLTREVLLSLLGGVWLGALLLHQSFWQSFPRSLDVVITVTADADKLKIIIFTMLMGGMVGIISRNGGTRGVVDAIARRARSARSGSIATWLLGMIVFFDDYASSLLIGTTMRPITDRLRISREKLAYVVDSTAAPITSLALISTWIGYEVSVLGDALHAAGLDRDPYATFLAGLPSRFYPIFALFFVLVVAWMGRDFGPMLRAERRARRTGLLLREGAAPLMDAGLIEAAGEMRAAPPRAWLAVLPLVVLVGTVLSVLLATGLAAAAGKPEAFAVASSAGATRILGFIMSNASSYDALLYAGAAGALVAMGTSVTVRAMTLRAALDAFVHGMRAMTMAVVVLCLAWSIARVMADLHAGAFVATLIGASLPPWSLGAITFILAALISFATGTSWGTMAILFPIVVPVAAIHAGAPGFETILLGATSAVLAGAVFGDHCSPISDTTVLSSIATSADHVDHTRTQIPYALLCGTAALVLGYLPLGLGVSAPLLLLLGGSALIVFLRFVGKHPEDP